MKKFSALAVALVLAAVTPALAQNLGKQADIVSKDKAPGTLQTKEAPAPQQVAPAPKKEAEAPAAATGQIKCVRVFVGIPAIKEPGRIIVSIQDTTDGLVEKMKLCNGDKAEAQRADSTKSVDVKTTQGDDGWATIKVPADRKPFVRARFHSTDKRLAANPFWTSKAFGDRDEIKLEAVAQGDALVVGKKNP